MSALCSSPTNGDVLALVGNGVSIAYNDNLSMPKLTDKLVKTLSEAAGAETDAGRALGKMVTDMPADDAASDFEALLGPLDQLTVTLDGLRDLSALAKGGEVTVKAVDEVADFARSLWRLGMSHVLEAIDEEAVAAPFVSNPVNEFVDALSEARNAGVPGRLTVANLNYDSLLLSRMLAGGSKVRPFDMASGLIGMRTKAPIHAGFSPIGGHRIRQGRLLDDTYFAGQPCILLHLHGSLSWLRSPSGEVARFSMQDLRKTPFHESYWSAWRDGKTDWEPAVVLANQKGKGDLVRRQPFAAAYDALFQRLLTCDKWLIAGYSFRDEVINQHLASAYLVRGRKPDVLVVTKSEAAPSETVRSALRLKDGEDASVSYIATGVADMVSTDEWKAWSAASLV